jgi:hypothetical protein
MAKSADNIDTLELLAVAVAVYRMNGNRVINNDPKATSNKESVKNHFLGQPTVRVSGDDRDQATVIKNYLEQKVMLTRLTGARLSNFLSDVVENISKQSVRHFLIGQLVWAPKLYDDSIKQDNVKQDISVISVDSKYIGKEKDKVELTFHLFDCKYNSNYNCYRHIGHDGKGNLIGFLNKNQIADKSHIRARIKSTGVSNYYGNGKVTYLNFVKVVS